MLYAYNDQNKAIVFLCDGWVNDINWTLFALAMDLTTPNKWIYSIDLNEVNLFDTTQDNI